MTEHPDYTADERLVRVPGLYRAWDVGLLLEEERIYRIEGAGRTDDGQALFTVHVDEPDGR